MAEVVVGTKSLNPNRETCLTNTQLTETKSDGDETHFPQPENWYHSWKMSTKVPVYSDRLLETDHALLVWTFLAPVNDWLLYLLLNLLNLLNPTYSPMWLLFTNVKQIVATSSFNFTVIIGLKKQIKNNNNNNNMFYIRQRYTRGTLCGKYG